MTAPGRMTAPAGRDAAPDEILECTVSLGLAAPWDGSALPVRVDLLVSGPLDGAPRVAPAGLWRGAVGGGDAGPASRVRRLTAAPGRPVSPSVRLRATAAAIVYRRSGDVVAGYPEADLEAAGETRDEAFAGLVALILETYHALATAAPETLGSQGRGQLAALGRIVDPEGAARGTAR